MIILFDEDEKLFSGLGLGILRDAISCIVTESLNDEYTLSMEYPVKGNNFEALQLNRIIYCRPNQYSSAQPFRIYSITKPLNGKVTIEAYHISYDMNDVAVGTINGANIRDTLDQIQNGVVIESNFKLYTDMTSTKKFKTSSPYNMRALLMGSDDSVLEKYEAEIRFDKWNAYITKQRGKNRGVQVRYAKNMTDLNHEINYDRLYNGVYPYYHKETTSVNSATSTGDFKQVYIVGKKPYQDGWLSYSSGGDAYHPIDESPVQIATDGDWYGKVYCWDSTIQRYVEKIYNQTVTLVEGVTSPDWIIIDWGSLPSIVCKANSDGYFKTTTDTTWTYHKTGETIFEGKITEISSLATNMILYYAEVIPSSSSSSSDEETSVTHVELSDKIIWLNTPEAKAMKRDRILMLDLTSEFSDDEEDDETDSSTSSSSTIETAENTSSDTSTDSSDDSDVPTEDELRAKAEKYIEKNKIGTIKFETSVSFVDLASTTEKDKYKDLEKIELGDTIKVVYNDIGIDVDLRVITIDYDVLKNAYEKIELGEKSETLSSNSVQNGDNVSSLTNDSDYANTSTVSKLIAKTVTADYILAKNAKLTTAQITELQTARIKCTGILEASQLELDQLVAKMITADNAAIANELSAGTVKVAGDITVNSGSISIKGGQAEFNVDRDGNLTANSVTITGGTLNINDAFEVTNDGILTAIGADIQGTIRANDGEIGGFTIGESAIYHTISSFEEESASGVYLGIDGIKLGNSFSVDSTGTVTISSGTLSIGDNFDVTNDGKLTAHDVTITGGTLSIGDNFDVTNDGKLTATGATINGTIEATDGDIGGFTIKNQYLYNGDIDSWTSSGQNGVYLGIEGIRVGKSYKITPDGAFNSGDESSNIVCTIDANGKLTAKSANILGTITAEKGYIGTEDAGFLISSSSISSGYSSASVVSYGENPLSEVVYVGSDAIRLGKDAAYALTASAAELSVSSALEVTLPTGSRNISGLKFKLTYPSMQKEVLAWVRYCKESGYFTSSYTITIGSADEETTESIFDIEPYDDEHCYMKIILQSGVSDVLTDVQFSTEKLPGFVVTKEGTLITTKGTVGGFNIGTESLYHNITSMSDENDSGVYLGSDGIKLGKNFGVNSAGYLYATNGRIGPLQVVRDEIALGSVLTIKDVPESSFFPAYSMVISGARIDTLLLNYNVREESSYFNGSWNIINASGFYSYISTSRLAKQQVGHIPVNHFSMIPYILGLGTSDINPRIEFRKITLDAMDTSFVYKPTGINSILYVFVQNTSNDPIRPLTEAIAAYIDDSTKTIYLHSSPFTYPVDCTLMIISN